MGLTIHYTLRSTSRSVMEIRQLVEQLRQRALDLPFQSVDELIDLAGDACDFEQRDHDDPNRWLLIQAAQHVERRGYSYSVAPTRLIAFSTMPGEGCEQANFGFCRYPSFIIGHDGRKVRTGLSGWYWTSFSKTQYASNPACGGVENFLRCHLSIVRLLDHARSLNMLDGVSDEGGFWERRNVQALSKEVGEWNEMIAGFVGRVNDWMNGGEGAELQSQITKFPDFEHLEARSRKA
jgi:hypothetical protein